MRAVFFLIFCINVWNYHKAICNGEDTTRAVVEFGKYDVINHHCPSEWIPTKASFQLANDYASETREVIDDNQSNDKSKKSRLGFLGRFRRSGNKNKPIKVRGTKEEREFREKDEKFRSKLQDDAMPILYVWATDYKVLVLDEILKNRNAKSCLEMLDMNIVMALNHKTSSDLIKAIMADLKSCAREKSKIDNLYQLEREIYLTFTEPQGKKLMVDFLKSVKDYFNDRMYYRKEFVGRRIDVKNNDVIATRLDDVNVLINYEKGKDEGILVYPLPVLQQYFSSFLKVTKAIIMSKKGPDRLEDMLAFINFVIRFSQTDAEILHKLALGFVKFAVKHEWVKPVAAVLTIPTKVKRSIRKLPKLSLKGSRSSKQQSKKS